MPSAVALIPARSGSERVQGQERPPARGTSAARLRDRDRAAVGHLRPRRLLDRQRQDRRGRAALRRRRPVPASARSSRRRPRPTSSGSRYTLDQLGEHYDLFAIVRATNPFRGPDVLQRGLQQLLATPEADSIRAVELVKQHPGKMWVVDGKVMRPLLDQSHLDVAWHAGQYQALPEIYVQNSALEIAWTRVVSQTGTREGRVVAPVLHPRTTRASTSTTRRTGPAPAPWWTPGRRRCPESTASNLRILPRNEGRAARDALLRRRLASVDLPQGHDGRRRRRLGRDHRLARLAARPRRHRRGPRAARRRPRPARGRADRLGSLPRDAAEPGLGDPEGDRRDRERAARPQGEGARRSGVRALRRADARRRRRLLVALRHDACARLGGDEHRRSSPRTTTSRSWARGRRARLPGLQDEHRHSRRRAAGADARLPRRRARSQSVARAGGSARAAARRLRRRDEGRPSRSSTSTSTSPPRACCASRARSRTTT